ncbi:hypothetical protein B0H17DRAFT_199282 [Mycena rosella]|uniref:Uncharacterized protein n=1 Tax=Mycena rosella TaxID=1033263 RepID=A0AAD7DX30_MYCRO|nr:hypothetical protein B0H17DRAFT_199282 [Mycena rosella]
MTDKYPIADSDTVNLVLRPVPAATPAPAAAPSPTAAPTMPADKPSVLPTGGARHGSPAADIASCSRSTSPPPSSSRTTPPSREHGHAHSQRDREDPRPQRRRHGGHLSSRASRRETDAAATFSPFFLPSIILVLMINCSFARDWDWGTRSRPAPVSAGRSAQVPPSRDADSDRWNMSYAIQNRKQGIMRCLLDRLPVTCADSGHRDVQESVRAGSAVGDRTLCNVSRRHPVDQ